MRARSKGLSIAASASWLNAFAGMPCLTQFCPSSNRVLVTMVTPPMLSSLKYGTYILWVDRSPLCLRVWYLTEVGSFGGWCFLAAAFCFFIPETAGRSLEVRIYLLALYEPELKAPLTGYGCCFRRHEQDGGPGSGAHGSNQC